VTALARAEHHEALRALGAAATFDYRTVDPTDLGRFDVILDAVGTGMRPWRQQLNRRGRYLLLALGKPTDVAYLAASTVFGPRRIRFVQAPPDGQILAELTRRADEGAVRPVIAASFDLADIGLAHRALQRGGALGKQVVVVNPVSPDTAPHAPADHRDPPATPAHH
jgi:NADPH:quinone reductase-like Zn-dependent oxidoreductase